MTLSNLRISIKLMAMAVVAFLGILAVAWIGVVTLRSNLVQDREAKLRDVISLAVQDIDRVHRDGVAGHVPEAELIDRMKSTLRDLRYGNNDYLFAYDSAGVSLVLPDPKTEGQHRWDLMDSDGVPFVRRLIEGADKGGAFVAYRYPRASGSAPAAKIAFAMVDKTNGWIVGSGIYVDDVDAIFWSQVWRMGAFVAATVALVIVTCVLLGRSISRPVTSLTKVMHDLASGATGISIPYTSRHDEVGEMASALGVFKEHIAKEQELMASREMEHEAADREKKAALLSMADNIEVETTAALEQVAARTDTMTSTADAMRASASRTGNSAESAAAASAHALANAQTVASAAEELSASIREIAAQATQSSEVVSRAVSAGADTRATIEALNEQVVRIGAVADMIGEIAAKTNLLALNATIEAARAGDAGKGFAVVAAEVKALATQTAHSTEEIARHISEVRAATGTSVAAVARIERTIGEIDAIAGSIAAAVEEQQAATAEIARNVTETAAAAREMTSRTNEVSAEAEQTGKHAIAVRENAAGLNTAVSDLRHSVIRVVRNSTTEVDRCGDRRHPVNLVCHLTIAGQSSIAHIEDLSKRGASVRCEQPADVGARGTLEIDGVGFTLPFHVRSVGGDILHVELDLDAATAAKFDSVTERLVMRHAA
jgi:methyl-accepting chemotaxis protein